MSVTPDGTSVPRAEPGRRRRRLLARSAPVVLVAVLVGSLLLGIWGGSLWGRAAYDAGEHAEAARRYAYQQRWTDPAVEPWKAWFNAGTAELRGAEHFRATETLRGALSRVPAGTPDPSGSSAECRVRTNLSLALEGLGDESRAAADPAMAETYYTEAMDVIGVCSTDGESESESESQDEQPGSPQDRAEQRQRDKQRESAAAQRATEDTDPPDTDPQETDPESGDTTEPDDQPVQPEESEDGEAPPGEDQDEPLAPEEEDGDADPRRQELEERNREAERERSRQEQERGGQPGGGQNW
ncbi:hypothetical protein PU560_10065 [Georgenia sp. 10Sc9-8]|uniref:MNN4 protein n=1 Tax=Georgenia halotolerans TaxID=3028317 RepID=A0ABT5TXL6_9MICO|nr:hypothetical protein [Georgenia halotolerans]